MLASFLSVSWQVCHFQSIYATKWIDIRKVFAIASIMYGQDIGMQFKGRREHCGLDDTRNIARVMVQMTRDGCVLNYTYYRSRFMPQDALNNFAKNS